MGLSFVRSGRRVRSVVVSMVLAAAVAIGISAVTATPALAHFYSGGGASAHFTIKPYHYNSSWMPPLNQSLRNWNATSTPAQVTKSSSSRSKLIAAQYSASWYGLYSPHGTRKHRYFTIRVNARTIFNDAHRWSNFVTSVFTHEMGHRLSLNDLNGWCKRSLMSHCRNRNRMTKPQRHDVRDVRRYY